MTITPMILLISEAPALPGHVRLDGFDDTGRHLGWVWFLALGQVLACYRAAVVLTALVVIAMQMPPATQMIVIPELELLFFAAALLAEVAA